ncbi:MAG: hypothetical protein PHE89_06050 [Alphaproteobacteria bacterium]|nr:hypothetical protein [Alphaproteobacteria bacterium]
MKFKKRCFLLCLFALSGCNLYGIPSRSYLSDVERHYNNDIYAKGGKAAIVIDSTNNFSRSFPVYTYLDFEDERGNKLTLKLSSNPVIYMVSPGTYKLKNHSAYGGKTYGNTYQFIDLDFAARDDAEFTVKAGDFIYLGKIETKITNVRKRNSLVFFSAPSQGSDVDYIVSVIDNLSKTDSDFVNRFEEKTGKKLTANLINWKTNKAGEKNEK